MKLHEKDLEIAEALRAGESVESISNRLGLPKSTVYYHIGKMKKAGAIKGFKVSLDYETTKDYQSAFILIALNGTNSKDINEFIDSIRKEKTVSDIYLVSGEWDFIFRVNGTKEEVTDFLSRRLQTMSFVKKTYSMFLLKHFEN